MALKRSAFARTYRHVLLDEFLKHERGNVCIPVGNFDGGCLLKQGRFLGIGGNEASRTLIRVFVDQIASDGARLVEGETVIVLNDNGQCSSTKLDEVYAPRCKEPGRMAGF